MIARNESKLVVLLCALAAARVFLFCAAFPFFNNVDEQAHVDLVVKYAHAKPPRSLENFSDESARDFSLYSTPEYFLRPDQYDTGNYPLPNWTLSAEMREQSLREDISIWQSRLNHESGEPPFYYAVAGAWLNLGRAVGIGDGRLLYWVRFLNVFVAAGLVWVGFIAAQLIFPDRPFARLTVPMLLAIWPQSAFYSIQSDTLSPFCFGIAFVGLLKLLRTESPTIALGVWTGLTLAASCLAKTSNLPLIAVAGLAVIFKVWQLASTGKLRRAVMPFGVLAFCTAAPIGIWFAWNYHTFGDLTATSSKIELLGWTRKPMSDWWSHPIFTAHGLKEFWSDLLTTFWRGEFIWHGGTLASPWLDAFYWISSTLILAVAIASLVPQLSILPNEQRRDLLLALLSFVSLVAFLALLSIAYDFGSCVYPSREHPYFTSGRLLSATAVPFFLLYACAIDWTIGRIKNEWPRCLLFGAFILFVAISAAVVNWPVFSSQYNFFHMSGGSG